LTPAIQGEPVALRGSRFEKVLGRNTVLTFVQTLSLRPRSRVGIIRTGFSQKTSFLVDKHSFINDTLRVYEIRHYLTKNEKDVFMEWRRQLRDASARIAVDRRIGRMELGNFGDHKFCRDGVWELRIEVGPGYRVYYAVAEDQLILLLRGGGKRTQDADIEKASEYWHDWQRRKKQ
jgi:putative addiction module killer protein